MKSWERSGRIGDAVVSPPSAPVTSASWPSARPRSAGADPIALRLREPTRGGAARQAMPVARDQPVGRTGNPAEGASLEQPAERPPVRAGVDQQPSDSGGPRGADRPVRAGIGPLPRGLGVVLRDA